MRALLTLSLAVFLISPALAGAQEHKLYKWVDSDGVVHYGDTVPPEYAENEKEVLNSEGVTVDRLRGKLTEAEIQEQKRQEQLREQRELQRRSDMALLATYLTVDEIIMHRDRRIELFQAQARVTELYLRNLHRRLVSLQVEATNYRPYNDDANAPLIDPGLMDEINETKETITRHEGNLLRFEADEKKIGERFAEDIVRFKRLNGISD